MLKLNMWKFLRLYKYHWNISFIIPAWIYAAATDRADTKKRECEFAVKIKLR